jgi:uncharacterized membrane protein
MPGEYETSLEQRVTDLEARVAELSLKFDRGVNLTPEPIPIIPRSPVRPPKAVSAIPPRPAEWWLARGGAVLTVFALILLYQYAVDHNWITPAFRIAVGILTGAALMAGAHRIVRASDMPDEVIGLREVLMGAALAAWYVTAYAAAVFYGLVSVPTARFMFVALSVVGAWLALKERRASLALLSLAAGFSAPLFLESPLAQVSSSAFYLGVLAAAGLVLYLMRGWKSVIWLTFIAFFTSTAALADLACCTGATASAAARISLTILIVIATAAMTRVPVLRRRLLSSGSPLYTESVQSNGTTLRPRLSAALSRFTGYPAAHDSFVLWIITCAAPIFGTVQLATVWPSVSVFLWAAIMLLVAGVAHSLTRGSNKTEDEVTHLAMAATSLWSLAAMLLAAKGVSLALGISRNATQLIAASIHAFVMIRLVNASAIKVHIAIARATALALVAAVIVFESGTQELAPYFSLAEAIAIGFAIWTVWLYRTDVKNNFTMLVAITSYVALLMLDARVLGAVLHPLVTASYALIGAGLLIAGRMGQGAPWLRKLGGLTLVLVILRLLIIDMAGLETIWRVLLFLGCGALFLFTSHRLKGTETVPPVGHSV